MLTGFIIAGILVSFAAGYLAVDRRRVQVGAAATLAFIALVLAIGVSALTALDVRSQVSERLSAPTAASR